MKEIKLTRGHFTLVDDEDFNYLNQFSWYTFSSHGILYAARSQWNSDLQRSNTILMHRIILAPNNNDHIDHADGNGLNNQRSNLRTCNNQTNHFNQRTSNRNKTGYKGVSFCSTTDSYRAVIQINKKQKYLGRFSSKEEAAQAYNNAAMLYYKEFAKLNIIKGV